jgi:hypothetical protein
MAIRITQKRPIALKALAASGNTLDVPFNAQEQSNWCWSACYQMVFSYFSFSLTQCKIAQQVPWNSYSNCCGKPECCNNAASVANVAQGWNKWSYANTYSSASIPFSGIQTTIDNNNIVQAGLSITGGGLLLVLVIGYVTGNTGYVHVNDPSNTQASVMTYGYLQSAYGKGTWSYTWNNIHS